jgi:hypothetical protein
VREAEEGEAGAGTGAAARCGRSPVGPGERRERRLQIHERELELGLKPIYMERGGDSCTVDL